MTAIKIWFRFEPREQWPSYDTEGLWATRLSADTARIDNVAFLQDGVAQGDVIRFEVVALDVPADADFRAIKQALEAGEANGWWYYEVGCGNDRWWTA